MLIQTRDQFSQLKTDIANAKTVCFDIESNGLHVDNPDVTQLIGLAVYVPEVDRSYYLPVRHGIGALTNISESEADGLTYQSKDKKLFATQQTYAEHIASDVQQTNCPLSWLHELKDVWTAPDLHIAHNAQFDLTGLDQEGFPQPDYVADTMTLASVLYTDWTGNPIEGVFSYFKMPDTGKEERGNRRLKWLARLFKIDGATEGEAALDTAVADMKARLDEHHDYIYKIDKKEHMWMLPAADVAPYAELDVRLTWGLYEVLSHHIDEWDQSHIADLHNRLQYNVAWQMHRNGFRLDLDAAQDMIDAANEAIVKETERVIDLSGGTVENPNSPQQLLAYMQACGLNVEDTQKSTLKRHQDSLDVIDSVLQIRKMSKLSGTYIEKWVDNHVNGFIHPELNVLGTSTGRWSSSSSFYNNLQNIPRTGAGSDVEPKRLLKPPRDDMYLFEIDYSNLELRIGAWVAETLIAKGSDTTLTDLLIAGEDMHSVTTDKAGIVDILLAGRTVDQYLDDNNMLHAAQDAVNESKFSGLHTFFYKKVARQTGKILNFLSMYGGGARAVTNALNVSKSLAYDLVDGWRRAYPAIPEAMKTLEQMALTVREAPNGSGEWQYIRYPLEGLDLIRKYNYYEASRTTKNGGVWSPRQKMARSAFNSVVQGLAGLICVASIQRLHNELGFAQPQSLDSQGQRVYDYTNGRIVPLTTVHDSVILALRPQDVGLLPKIETLMTDWDVYPRLEVDFEVAPLGKAWGYKEEIKDLNAWIKTNK